PVKSAARTCVGCPMKRKLTISLVAGLLVMIFGGLRVYGAYQSEQDAALVRAAKADRSARSTWCRRLRRSSSPDASGRDRTDAGSCRACRRTKRSFQPAPRQPGAFLFRQDYSPI